MIKKGDILFFNSNTGIFAKIIKFFLQSKFYHVALIIDIYKKQDGFILEVIEAKFLKGVQVNIYEYNPDKYVIFRHIDITKKLSDTICNQSIQYIGSKYDLKALFSWFFLKITFRDKRDRLSQNNNKFFCSEFISLLFFNNGLLFHDTIPANNITPVTIIDSKYTKKIKFK